MAPAPYLIALVTSSVTMRDVPALPGLRQGPAGEPCRDRREQAARRGSSLHQEPAGHALATPAEDQKRADRLPEDRTQATGPEEFRRQNVRATTIGGDWRGSKIGSDDISTLRNRGHFNLVATWWF